MRMATANAELPLLEKSSQGNWVGGNPEARFALVRHAGSCKRLIAHVILEWIRDFLDPPRLTGWWRQRYIQVLAVQGAKAAWVRDGRSYRRLESGTSKTHVQRAVTCPVPKHNTPLLPSSYKTAAPLVDRAGLDPLPPPSPHLSLPPINDTLLLHELSTLLRLR
jgi:hypothetical protein